MQPLKNIVQENVVHINDIQNFASWYHSVQRGLSHKKTTLMLYLLCVQLASYLEGGPTDVDDTSAPGR